MKFFLETEERRQEMSVNDLSSLQLRQATVVADTVARLIPHEGVDYEVDIPGSDAPFGIRPVTDKGEAWGEYVSTMMRSDPPRLGRDPHMDATVYIGRLIPVEGVDYDPCLTFRSGSAKTLSYTVVPRTAKGRFWMRYVTSMLKKAKKGQENEKVMS